MRLNPTRTARCLVALLLSLWLAATAWGAGSAASRMMSQAMLSMMDAMGNLAQKFNRNQGWSSSSYLPPSAWQGLGYAPWGMSTLPGGGIPGQQQLQGVMGQAPAAALSGQQAAQGLLGQTLPGQAPGRSPLDGIWRGQRGEIVLVMYGMFRIYANADTYRDGRYEVQGNKLVMIDPSRGTRRSYDFALDQGRLVLRDRDGNLLLFRQLPIPVPPYSLFTGQGTASAQQQPATNQQQK